MCVGAVREIMGRVGDSVAPSARQGWIFEVGDLVRAGGVPVFSFMASVPGKGTQIANKQGRIHGHQLRTGGQGRKCNCPQLEMF